MVDQQSETKALRDLVRRQKAMLQRYEEALEYIRRGVRDPRDVAEEALEQTPLVNPDDVPW